MNTCFFKLLYCIALMLGSTSHALLIEFSIEAQETRNIASTIDHAFADIAHSTIAEFMAKFPPSYPYGNHPLLTYAHHSFITISRSWHSFINIYHHNFAVHEALYDLLESLSDLDIALNRFHVKLNLSPDLYIEMLETINDILDDIIYLMNSRPTQNTLLIITDNFDEITNQLYRVF